MPANTWLQILVDSYVESEAPQLFFYWSGIAAISAVIRRNVWLDRFTYKLYPNVYVFIVGKSGVKKGIPVSVIKDIVDIVNVTRVIKGRSSVPAIIRDLSRAFTLENGSIIKNAEGFIVSGELAASLVKDADSLSILTDLYNTHENEKQWVNSLKVSGIDTLLAPCITMLCATNEENFEATVPQVDVKNGFIARTFISYSEDEVKLNSLTQKPKALVNRKSLAQYLIDIKDTKGEFTWSQKVKDYYDSWYYPFYKDIASKDDPTGTFHRIGDQILKVAMLVSLSESNSLELEERHIYEAITVCMNCAKSMMKVTMGNGKSPSNYITKIILRDLLTAQGNQLSRKIILSRHWGEFDKYDLSRSIETLRAFDAIEILGQCEAEHEYKLNQKVINMYSNFNNKIN